MAVKITLTPEQTALKSQLKELYDKVWRYIESDQELLFCDDALNKLYSDMAHTAHELHISLEKSGYKVKHHKYMLENRGCSPEDERFYEHVHPVQDLLKFTEDVHANDDPEDKTIGDTFTMKVYTRRWWHYEYYLITRTKKGWDIQAVAKSYTCRKDASQGLNKLLEHDSVCYPKQINEFFKWLWDRAAEDGLTKAEVQKAITQLGKWISECEMSAPRDGVFEGLI